MITSPTSNVKLTFDQIQAIDTTEKRLSVLESEITNAQKILKGTRMECDRAVKEQNYQEGILSTLSLNVDEAKSELTKTNEELTSAKSELSLITSQVQDLKKSQEEASMKLKEREDTVTARENAYVTSSEDLNTHKNEFKNQVGDFNEKVDKLKEVLSTF